MAMLERGEKPPGIRVCDSVEIIPVNKVILSCMTKRR
jgi:hypothetical protein